MARSGFVTPKVAFSTIDYSSIEAGSYFFGFDTENGDSLTKLDNLGNITVIEGAIPPLNFLPLAGGTLTGTLVMNTSFIQSLDGLSQLDFGNGSGYIALTSDGQDYIEPFCYVSNGNISSRTGVLGYSNFKIGIGDNPYINNFLWGDLNGLSINHNALVNITSIVMQLTTDNGGFAESWLYMDNSSYLAGFASGGQLTLDNNTAILMHGALDSYVQVGPTQILIGANFGGGAAFDYSALGLSLGSTQLPAVSLIPGIAGITNVLQISDLTIYLNDAAADADANLPSGGLYLLTGDRTVYRKP